MKTLLSALRARCRLTSLLILLLYSPAPAQTQPPAVFKLIAVKVTGSKRFTTEEIAATSGLPVGTIAHEDDFKKAARQLGETGAFVKNVTYSYSYTSAGTKLEFQVTDADKFVPARFTDFVWFTDEELLHQLHQRVPLFTGELPLNGRLIDQVSDVLQALLVENAIPGIIEYRRVEARDRDVEAKEKDKDKDVDAKNKDDKNNDDKDGQVLSIDFKVTGVSIRIHHAEFAGAGASEMPLLQAAAEKISDREYSRDYMNNFIEHTLLPLYREHGYLKAECAPAQPKVVKLPAPDSNDNKQPPTFVDVTFPLTTGLQYKATGWDWSGNKEIPSNQLEPFLHVKTGETANTAQLEKDLHGVQTLYSSHGYILAAIKGNAELDDVSGGVRYHLVVQEGALYRMGELQFRGLDNNLTARVRAIWKIRPGDIYDATYLNQFLPEAKKLLPANLDWVVDPHVTAIARDKTVDVDLQYTVKAVQ